MTRIAQQLARLVLITLAVTGIAAAPILPASAGAPVDIYYGSGSCGSPAYTYGTGTTTSTMSLIAGSTIRTGGGASCTYRAVQLNWWNGSGYTTTSWDEQMSQNASVYVEVWTFGYSTHRLGASAFAYTLESSTSWS